MPTALPLLMMNFCNTHVARTRGNTITYRPALGVGTFERSLPLLRRTAGLCDPFSPPCTRNKPGMVEVGVVAFELEGLAREGDRGGMGSLTSSSAIPLKLCSKFEMLQ